MADIVGNVADAVCIENEMFFSVEFWFRNLYNKKLS